MPVIAILTDSFGHFQRRYIDGIAARLKPHGFGILTVSGRELKPDPRWNQPTYNNANRIFSIAKSYDVSGYILLSGCIGHNLGRTEIDGFAREFTSIPTVSLGVDVPSASSICSSSQNGMRELMEHLTEDRSRRNFVFIRGFKNDIDSIEREDIFREVLAQRGIPVQEHLILTGNYIAVDAYNALDAAVAMHPEIDVVVAANDNMAAAAIEVLKKHKYSIPTDVVVSGFDNSSLAKETSPPLTSIGQPFEKQIIATVDTLLAMIEDPITLAPVRPPQFFSSELFIRESTLSKPLPDTMPHLAFSGSLDEAWDHFMHTFIADYELVLNQGKGCDYKNLFSMIRERLEMQPAEMEEFFKEFSSDAIYGNQDRGWWFEFEKLLATLALRLSKAMIFGSYLTQLLELQTLVRNFNISTTSSEQHALKQSSLHLSRLEIMLARSQVFEEVMSALDNFFSYHNVKRVFLVLYNSKSGSVDCLARVAYAYGSDLSLVDLSKVIECTSFESKDVLPQALKEELNKGTLILDPLFFDEMQLGYSLIDPSGVDTVSIECFSFALSEAVNRCFPLMAADHIAKHLE